MIILGDIWLEMQNIYLNNISAIILFSFLYNYYKQDKLMAMNIWLLSITSQE